MGMGNGHHGPPGAKCGHTWYAPYAGPNGKITGSEPQVCNKPWGHDGDHQSVSKVITSKKTE